MDIPSISGCHRIKKVSSLDLGSGGSAGGSAGGLASVEEKTDSGASEAVDGTLNENADGEEEEENEVFEVLADIAAYRKALGGNSSSKEGSEAREESGGNVTVVAGAVDGVVANGAGVVNGVGAKGDSGGVVNGVNGVKS